MISEGSNDYSDNILLLSVVKILSDNGLKKTLKKLRKETNSDHLRPEQLPDFIANADFNKLVSKLLKKSIKSSKNKRTESATKEKVKKSKEDSKVLPGFVRSQILQGTIETLKNEHPITHTKNTDSNTSDVINNGSGSDKNPETATTNDLKSGLPFKRINDEVWLSKIDKEELKRNAYRAKGDSFALKDAEQLSLVKGKDFRSQKYKKKRSSWKGSGEITNSVNSVIFSDSDS
ncbi:hypothetical protein MACK_001877 [Theileria orientalis]|uniref:Srp40 C-terminal domain-containing protein n=1 Tax=Theileria orientalis TaxID=68886 RepID=A0A976MB38_THEOR|nr:hypothetical protein MACK_001877 [Theileria orientalis]